MEMPNFSTEPIITLHNNRIDNEDYYLSSKDNEKELYKNYSELERDPNTQIEPIFYRKKFKRPESSLFVFIKQKLSSLFDPKKKLSKKEEFYLKILLIILIVNFFIKEYIFFCSLFILFRNFLSVPKFFCEFLFSRIYGMFLFLVDLIFLLIGIVLLFCENFIQLGARFTLMENVKENSLKPIILSKFLFFISLGMIPELSIAMLGFKNKNNIILSIFKMKFGNQPIVLIFIILYFLYLFNNSSEDDKKTQIKKHFIYLKIYVMNFLDKYVFLWNDFQEEKIKNDDKDLPSDEEKKNGSNKKIKDNKESKEEKENKKKQNFVGNMEKEINGEENMKKLMDKKGDKNNKKIVDEEIEDEEDNIKRIINNNKKKDKGLGTLLLKEFSTDKKEENSFLGKIKNYLTLKKFSSSIKKYIVLGFVAYILVPIIINGIFEYSYYVFSFSNKLGKLFFMLDLILSFVFGYFLIKLENAK